MTTSFRKVLQTVVATALLLFVAREVYERSDRPDISPLAEFEEMKRDGIVDISISSFSAAQKSFEVHLDAVQRARFVAAMNVATQEYPPGHASAASEASFRIVSASSTATYYAAAYTQQPADLYLRREVAVVAPNGSRKVWPYQNIRIPQYASWLKEIAPDAVR